MYIYILKIIQTFNFTELPSHVRQQNQKWFTMLPEHWLIFPMLRTLPACWIRSLIWKSFKMLIPLPMFSSASLLYAIYHENDTQWGTWLLLFKKSMYIYIYT